MSKLLFIINDNGNEYVISDTRLEMNNDFVVDPNLYYETYSEDFFYFVKELVDGDNLVKYPKNIDFAATNLLMNNGEIIVTAVNSGISGNDISVEIIDPSLADQTLEVNVSSNDITVNLGTDSTGAIISTIQEVSDAINANNILVSSGIEAGGTYIASAVNITSLTGGEITGTVNDDDLIITPLDALTIYKARTRTRGKHILKQYCDFTLQFDFFKFHILNNQLIDAGYIITDENREEKYLEIINTSDETLISILEAYLEIRDSIMVHTHHYDNFQSFKTTVNDAIDTAAVDIAFNDFSALYE